MKFFKLFLIDTSKDPNLAEKLTYLAKIFFFKSNSTEFMELVFSRSAEENPQKYVKNTTTKNCGLYFC